MAEDTNEARGIAILSDSLDGDGPFTVHGVAIGDGDVTQGQSGITKLWTAEALRPSAGTLENKPIVKNHVNTDVDAVVGEVLKTKFVEGLGVVWEGELDDKDLALKVKRGRLDVSPRILHQPVDEMEEDEETGAKVVTEVRKFFNLSLVPTGAAPSNSVSLGESSEVAAAALWSAFGYSPTVEGSESSIEALESESGEDSGEEGEMSQEGSEELARHSVHEVEWSGTTEGEWNKPSLSDFTDESWEDLSRDEKVSIGNHFLVSATGFPAETFGDLSLPVVDPAGNLNLNALQNAKARVNQVKGLSQEDQDRAVSIINRLANELFDTDFEENQQEEGGDESSEDNSPSPLAAVSVVKKNKSSTVGDINLL